MFLNRIQSCIDFPFTVALDEMFEPVVVVVSLASNCGIAVM